MSSPKFSSSDLASTLGANGLKILGSFQPNSDEVLFPDRKTQPGSLAIVGNVGSSIWPHYRRARRDNPTLTLDSWTEETVGEIADEFNLDAVYPFEGPPFHPFIRWAERTGTLLASPIGLTIHPVYGLWIAFRAALLIDHPVLEGHAAEAEPVPARHPCADCWSRPCLTACPVGAFTEDGYEFEACLDHLATPVNTCRQRGCLARIACPVGQDFRYEGDHAAFHMNQLLKARGRS